MRSKKMCKFVFEMDHDCEVNMGTRSGQVTPLNSPERDRQNALFRFCLGQPQQILNECFHTLQYAIRITITVHDMNNGHVTELYHIELVIAVYSSHKLLITSDYQRSATQLRLISVIFPNSELLSFRHCRYPFFFFSFLSVTLLSDDLHFIRAVKCD